MQILSKAIPITMLAFVLSSMLAVGLSLTVVQILAPLRNFKLVGLALTANFVLLPIGAFALARVLRLDEPLANALVLLGVAAGAPFLPKLAAIARGDLAFSVGMMVLLMVLTVAYMPFVLPLLIEGVSVDPLRIARSLAILMLLPLGIGLVLNTRIPRLAEKVRFPLNTLSSISLALVTVLLLVTNLQNVIGFFGTRGVLAAVLFIFGGLESDGFLAVATGQ
jgi:BASS family bile acid:Na+ symporter